MGLSPTLQSLILEHRLLWVLIQDDGTARLSAPYGLPPREIFGDPEIPAWVTPLGSPLEPILECALAFLERRRAETPSWAVMVSLLKERHDLAPEVERLLPPAMTRRLEEAEYGVLRKLGMTVPMGDWVRQDTATLYLVRQKGE